MSETRITRFPEDTGDALSAELAVLDGAAYITVIPTDATGAVVTGGIAAQSERIFDHLERKLAKVDASLENIAQFTVYLYDLPETRAAFNAVYAQRMPKGKAPMRCVVGVAALARPEMLVEVSAIAEVLMQAPEAP